MNQSLKVTKRKKIYEKLQNLTPRLTQIEELGLIKVDMAKKLIANRALEIVKIGNKIHISRAVLLKFIESNTIEASS